MVSVERIQEAFDQLSADEQRAILQAYETSNKSSDVAAIVMAIDRARGRRFSYCFLIKQFDYPTSACNTGNNSVGQRANGIA